MAMLQPFAGEVGRIANTVVRIDDGHVTAVGGPELVDGATASGLG